MNHDEARPAMTGIPLNETALQAVWRIAGQTYPYGDLEYAGKLISAHLREVSNRGSISNLEDLRAWASVGRTGKCVHSKRVEWCAGCELRIIKAQLAITLDALEEIADNPINNRLTTIARDALIPFRQEEA
jgi:hypothetical protein